MQTPRNACTAGEFTPVTRIYSSPSWDQYLTVGEGKASDDKAGPELASSRIRILARCCLILKLNKLYAEQGKPGAELKLRDWH
ncbi:hypothetical protein PIB30_013143 [Stylosanthes scabra]|uniref:Uncharacterized protein n=1 Tax=Stylosanthes scabra TaxID=79078 RepID=A0ABU6X5Y2_9FABA|nr:hypothetical protein [Stylosanthes scabra]